MSRRCTCSRLMAALSGDPRLRTLPLGTRMLWLLIAEAMVATGGTLPFRSPARIALLVSALETEVETQLETLITEGLLAPEGQGLASPLVQAAATRSEAARRNGSRGGRPRAGETPEQARARRQGALLLPVAGGAAPETQETRAPETPHDDHDSITLESSHDHHPRAQASDAIGLAAELADSAGMDPVRSRWDARTVQGWLNAGATPALCREVIRDVMTRARQAPANFRYFERPIREALEARAAAARLAEARRAEAARPMAEDVQAILAWHAGGKIGPMPEIARPSAAA